MYAMVKINKKTFNKEVVVFLESTDDLEQERQDAQKYYGPEFKLVVEGAG